MNSLTNRHKNLLTCLNRANDQETFNELLYDFFYALEKPSEEENLEQLNELCKEAPDVPVTKEFLYQTLKDGDFCYDFVFGLTAVLIREYGAKTIVTLMRESINLVTAAAFKDMMTEGDTGLIYKVRYIERAIWSKSFHDSEIQADYYASLNNFGLFLLEEIALVLRSDQDYQVPFTEY